MRLNSKKEFGPRIHGGDTRDFASRLDRFKSTIKKWTIIDLPYVSAFQRHLFADANIIDDIFSLSKCRGLHSESDVVWERRRAAESEPDNYMFEFSNSLT